MDQPHLETLTSEDLFTEISDLAQERGVSTQEQWSTLVEAVVEDHLELGELNKDEDLIGIQDVLKARWTDYEEDRGIGI